MKIVELDAHGVNPGDMDWSAINELADFVCYDRTSPDEIVARAKDADSILINKGSHHARAARTAPTAEIYRRAGPQDITISTSSGTRARHRRDKHSRL